MPLRRMDEDLLSALYRFAWALTGEEIAAATLTREVVSSTPLKHLPVPDSRRTEVELFSAAYRMFSGGAPIPIPPAHERIALMDALSHQHADGLRSETLLKSFRELELPQRAALVLFYTTQCSLRDISAVLHRSGEETVAILSRGKAEWLHILHRTAAGGDPPSEGETP